MKATAGRFAATLSRAGAAPKLKEQQCLVGGIQKLSTGDFFREKTRHQSAEVGAPRLAPFRLAEERELTARRRADSAEALLEEAREDLQQECERAEKERKRAELLAEKLRSLGIDPDAA